jgi:hypothetical protein
LEFTVWRLILGEGKRTDEVYSMLMRHTDSCVPVSVRCLHMLSDRCPGWNKNHNLPCSYWGSEVFEVDFHTFKVHVLQIWVICTGIHSLTSLWG